MNKTKNTLENISRALLVGGSIGLTVFVCKYDTQIYTNNKNELIVEFIKKSQYGKLDMLPKDSINQNYTKKSQ